MAVIEYINPLLVIAVVTGLLSIYYFFSLLGKIKKFKPLAALTRLLSFSVFTSISFFLSLIILGTQGYKGLTKEEVVAKVKIIPTAEQQFSVRLTFANNEQQFLSLHGDELLLDAYILKWQPWANILGLHTGYRLERASGRYKDINSEKNKQRSVYAIKSSSSAGIGQWRQDYTALAFLLDVEHGSASFVDADVAKEYHLMITTDGLLIRPIDL